jgi:2-phospho-L-lactate/phosphoenolpyruvate guanylyltransferase
VRAIVLPVRSLDSAKSRLADVLTPIERAALTLAMLEDVLDATTVMPGWDTWVLSPDEAVLEIAAGRGVRPVTEAHGPLGTAVVQAETEAADAGVNTLAVVLPDLPLLTPAALTRALHTLGPVVLAPSADGAGTNLLLRRPPAAIDAHFGTDSFRRHLEDAAERDLPTSVIEARELAFDLDAPGDILTVLTDRRRTRTRAVLQEMDAGSRLADDAAAR